MKRAILILFMLFFMLGLSFCANFNTFPDKEWGEELKDPAKLKDLIDSGQTEVTIEGDTTNYSEYVIIDVRPSSAYNSGHIPTAINIANGNIKAYTDAGNTAPPTDAYIIVYCETGGRAEAAANTMNGDYGYLYIVNWGGYTRWGDAGYDYETSK